MTLIPPFLHRKSLSVAIVTLPVSFVLSLVFTPVAVALRTIDDAVYLRSAIASGFALILCCAGWFNLIRDVGREYSPSRCSLAAVLLLGASIWPVFVFAFVVRHLLFI